MTHDDFWVDGHDPEGCMRPGQPSDSLRCSSTCCFFWSGTVGAEARGVTRALAHARQLPCRAARRRTADATRARAASTWRARHCLMRWESVYPATNGHVSFFDEPLIRKIAMFPLHAHIAGRYFIKAFLRIATRSRCWMASGLHASACGQSSRSWHCFGLWLAKQRSSVRPLDTPADEPRFAEAVHARGTDRRTEG